MIKSAHIFEIVVIIFVLVFGFMFSAIVINSTPDILPADQVDRYVTTTYTENYESDTAGSDPSESWYTYTDTAWDYVFVNETDYRTANHSYEINDTDGNTHWTWYNWTSEAHTYYELYFKIDNSTHTDIGLTMEHSAGSSTDVRIYGKGTIEPYVSFSNYSTVRWNNTISNNTWWRLRWDFNYTDNTVRCRLYNNASVDQTATNSTWLLADPETGPIDITDTTGLYIWGSTGKSVQIYFDDMTLQFEDFVSGVDTQIRATQNLYATIVGVVIFAVVMTILFGVLIYFKDKK